jgi:hypothetical protein
VDTYYNADVNTIKSARETVEEESESLGALFRQQTMFA